MSADNLEKMPTSKRHPGVYSRWEGITITVGCFWGEGPDVAIVAHDDTGKQRVFIGFDNADDAVIIAQQLLTCALNAKQIDREYMRTMRESSGIEGMQRADAND